jgi:hypothetical protein
MVVTEPILTAADIAEQRAELSEPMLTDVCTITVPDPDAGAPVLDELTGQYGTVPGVVIYGPGAVDIDTGDPLPDEHDYLTGRCRFQIKADINSNIIETTAGDREWTYATAQLQLPVSALRVPIDSIVTSLTGTHNPALIDRVFNIHGEIAPKSIPIIRRFRLREVIA